MSDRALHLAAAVLLLAGVMGGARHLAAGRAPDVAPRAARAAEPERARPPVRPIVISRTVAAVTAGPPAVGALPGSLQGTAEDGELAVDPDGDLLVGPRVLALFDYYFTATGEESAAAIRARIVAAIHRRLQDARAAGQAIALLDTYVAYREAARSLRARGDDPAERLDALRRLRRAHFGEQAGALFGEHERAVDVAIAQRRVLQDHAAAPEDREARLSALEARLPDGEREARAEATRPLRDRAEEDALRAAGASDDDLYRRRVETYGEEAADRLAALDRARAAWRRRVSSYREARAAIERGGGDPARREAAVQALLEASFTPLEQIRVGAADTIDGR